MPPTTQQPAPANPPPARRQQTIAVPDPAAVLGVNDLRDLFVKALPQVQRALPAAMRSAAQRMVRCALTEFQRNADLQRCTGLSILSCVVQAAQLGLEIGGPAGQSYMVPYRNRQLNVDEAQFQVGYRGMISLAFRSGKVKNVFAELVYENDVFEEQRGTNPGILHQPNRKNPGSLIGVYAVLLYHGDSPNWRYMSVAEIDAHRQQYSRQGTDRESGNRKGIWQSAFTEQAMKTVLRKVLKHSPIAVEFPGVFDPEGDDGSIDVLPITAAPAFGELPARQVESRADDGVNEPDGRLFSPGTDTSAQAR